MDPDLVRGFLDVAVAAANESLSDALSVLRESARLPCASSDTQCSMGLLTRVVIPDSAGTLGPASVHEAAGAFPWRPSTWGTGTR